MSQMDLAYVVGILEYWLGITDCECHSDRPIGRCLKCDLVTLQRYLLEDGS